MIANNKPVLSAHDIALSHAKSITLDQLNAADEIVQSSALFCRNGPGYAEARLAIAQMISQNYTAAMAQTKDR